MSDCRKIHFVTERNDSERNHDSGTEVNNWACHHFVMEANSSVFLRVQEESSSDVHPDVVDHSTEPDGTKDVHLLSVEYKKVFDPEYCC